VKKKLNADSPSFTPSFTNLLAAGSSSAPSTVKSTISPKAAENAVPFIPKSELKYQCKTNY